MHGKNICDAALSNLPSNANTEALRSDDFIFSGSRNVVIDLTKARATPAVAKGRSSRAGGRSSASFTASFSSPPSPFPRLMASTAHTTSTCACTCTRGTAGCGRRAEGWAPNHVLLVLSRAAYRAVPCSVPHVATHHAPLLTPAPAPCHRPTRVPAVHRSSVGGLRDGPRSRSRRHRVPQARRPRAAANEVAGGVGRVTQGEAAGRRSAPTVARGALLAGGAQGEGAHAGRGHGRQHLHRPRGLSRGQGAQWLRLEQRECEGKADAGDV